MKSGRRSLRRRGRVAWTTGLALAVSGLALALPGNGAHAAPASDSASTDFWLGFPANLGGGPELTLFITGGAATTGTVAIPGLTFSETFSVTPGTVTSVTIPTDAQMTSSPTPEDKGIHVTAGAEVTVYGLNRVQATTDAYLGLPTDILGTEYIVLGSPPAAGESEGAVVSTANGTTVTITPSAQLDGGQPAGTPFTVSMDQGQTFQFTSSAGDVSGTVVTADKPIGVYGGNTCANIPDFNYFFCDHIVEQMPPVTAWGESFLTVPLATRLNGDTFRMVAAQDGTAVRINGSLVATLNRGQVWQQIVDGQSQITADKPILVAQYSNGTTYDDVTSDPFEMLIPPTEQFLAAYTISTPATGFSGNYVNVVAPTSSIASVRLDGAVVPAASFTAIGSTGFSGAQLTVDLGSHTVTGSLPVGVYSYGFADFDSYGYPGGMSLAPVATVNSLTLAPATETLTVGANGCVTATVMNNLGEPVVGVRVDFARTGANPGQGFAFTDQAGHAQHCYAGANAGDDAIVATLGALSANAAKTWTSVVNGAPVLTPGGPYRTAEGSPVTLGVDVTDSETPAGPFTYHWTPATGLNGANTATPSFTPTDNGTFSLTVEVCDPGARCATAPVVVTATNVAPDVTAPADQTASTAAPFSETVSFSDAGAADTHSATVDWGDGTPVEDRDPVTTGFEISHTYATPGSYQATMCVTDDDEGRDCATFTLTVIDTPRAQPDEATATEDLPVEILVLTNDSDPEGDLLEITEVSQPAQGTVEINDDPDPEVEDTVTYTPPLNFNGTTTFTYTVSDGNGGEATATVTVTVEPTNDEPVVAPGPDTDGVEGSAVEITGSATDVDGPEPLSYEWVILEGPEVSEEPSGSFANPNDPTTEFTPKQDGTYILQLEACDADELCDTEPDDNTLEVTVRNAAPVVTLPADRTVAAGFSTSVTVSFTDAGIDDAHTAVIDWGDGGEDTIDPAVSGFSGTHAFATTGTRTVEACVSDDAGDEACDTMTITVVAPTTLSIRDAAVREPDSGTASMTFTITASPVPATRVTVVAKTVNGSAKAPSDYTALPAAGQTVTFAAGQATRTVTVPVVGDLLREPNKSFTVVLSNPVAASISDGSAVGRITNNDTCTILGTAAAEALNGTTGNDVICGFGGNDVINGLGGNDTMFGGDGNDAIRGGPGNDTLRGQNGDDVLTGEAGNDVIDGGAGIDEASWAGAPAAVTADLTRNVATGWGSDTLATLERARGGRFNDTLRGNGLRNNLWGGDGNDTLQGRSADDQLDGQNGNDTVRGDAGHDTLMGGASDDRLDGGDGNDKASGGNGNDRVDGGAGVDLVKGDAGNDQTFGGSGNDSSPNGTTAGVHGGSGTNSVNGGTGTDYCSRGRNDTRTSCERP
jgi:Ca2+-binding RTX toxin-like protein